MAHLDQDEVVLDDTVTNETTDGGDSLLGNIELGRSRSLVVGLSNTVDLLVDPRRANTRRESVRAGTTRVTETKRTRYGDGNRLDQHGQPRT